MRPYLFVILSFVLAHTTVPCLSLEEALSLIQQDSSLDKAEKNRQSAVLYRMNKQMEKAFNVLENSLQNYTFNEWMLEDFAGMAEHLKEQKALQKCASLLEKSKDKTQQLAGLLLKCLAQVKSSPELVIETLRQYSSQNKTQECSGLFLLILQKAYNAIGNNERSQYFQELMRLKYPNYYLLKTKDSPTLSQISSANLEPSEMCIIQVGCFKSANRSAVDKFKNQLQNMGLKTYEEEQGEYIRLRIKTLNICQTLTKLKQAGIDFYIVKGDSYKEALNTLAKNSLNKKLSTLQLGSFTHVCGAEKQRELLAKDGFPDTQILWQEDKKLFYVFIQTHDAPELLKKLKAKGYDAFVKNLEKLNF